MAKKHLLRAFVLLLTFLLCGGCGVQEQSVQQGKVTEEAIFTKTVHDFGSLQVVNLDEREDTNFVVYAEGVQQIVSNETTNMLRTVEEEKQIYVFAAPDEQLRAMKAGDVFWAEPSQANPNGLAVKVGKIEYFGETLTVYGEPLALDDLFVYVDIDMPLTAEEIYYDTQALEPGMEMCIEREEQVPLSAPQTKTQLLSPSDSDGQGSKLTFLGQTEDNMQEWESTVTVLSLKDAWDVQIGKSGGGTAAEGHMTITSSLGIRLHVKFRYSAEDNYFSADVLQDVEQSTEVSAECNGSWSNGIDGRGRSWPVFSAWIPNTPICVGGEFYLLTTLSGGMKGSLSSGGRYSMGVCVQSQNLRFSEVNDSFQDNGTYTDASLELEGTVEVLYGARLDIGIPFVVDVFLEGGVGARAQGRMNMVAPTEGEDCIHDCDRCIDGDIDLIARLSCGVDARVITTLTGYDLVLRKDLADYSVKIGDFYASFRSSNGEALQCGWGECPYLRWKTEVFVKTSEGNPAEDTTVQAQYADGRTAECLTNSQGKAVLYLPNGENSLNCLIGNQRGSAQITVAGAPTSVIITLEGEQRIFILYTITNRNQDASGFFDSDYHDPEPGDFSEVYAQLSEAYPDAVWIAESEARQDDWNTWVETETSVGDIIISVTAEKSALSVYHMDLGKRIDYPDDYTYLNVLVYLVTTGRDGGRIYADGLYERTASLYWSELPSYNEAMFGRFEYRENVCRNFVCDSGFRIHDKGDYVAAHGEDLLNPDKSITMGSFLENYASYRNRMVEYTVPNAITYIDTYFMPGNEN